MWQGNPRLLYMLRLGDIMDNNTENKCCPVKIACKVMCCLVVIATLVIMSLLYIEARNVRVELKELNTSLDYAAQYLDIIKADMNELNNNARALKEDVAEIKNKTIIGEK